MCNCFETKLQEIDSKAKELSNVVASHSLWSDEGLNFKEISEYGLSVNTQVKIRKISDKFSFELKNERSLIPFSFCPFCGEKLGANEYLLTQDEDDALLKIFYLLEETLEERFDNITVSNMDEVVDMIHEEMHTIEKTFLLQRDEEKQMVKLLHQGNFQDYTIEIYLEPDEDGLENIYTLSVF